MESSPLRATYRAILTEMLLAHSAAIGAFVDVAAHTAQRVNEEYRQALESLARKIPPEGAAGPAHPGGGSRPSPKPGPRPADLVRELAGMPRVSAMVFLSRYDKLRGRRSVVRD
jgi:CubicO group peptidase (beta-lactamase class C family)